MAELRLEALERLAAAATPGPWTVEHAVDPRSGKATREVIIASPSDKPPRMFWIVAQHLTSADGAFVAAAREAVPALIERVHELEEAVARHWLAVALDEWHAGSEDGQTLPQRLGLSESDYAAWVEGRSTPRETALRSTLEPLK